jgi:DNA-binding transcriptional LysR family regulator
MRAFENFNLLRAFVCIVECGNISAGALLTPDTRAAISHEA